MPLRGQDEVGDIAQLADREKYLVGLGSLSRSHFLISICNLATFAVVDCGGLFPKSQKDNPHFMDSSTRTKYLPDKTQFHIFHETS